MMLPSTRVLSGLLWGFNGFLGVGVLAYAWFFLLLPKDGDLLKNFPWEDNAAPLPAGPAKGDDTVLKALRNPLKGEEPRAVASQPNNPFRAVLKGTIPSLKDPKNSAAFIRSSAKNVDLLAFIGEEIQEGGKPYDEFRGWKLVEVGKYQATFTNGAQKVSLNVQDSPAQAAPPSPTPGQGPAPAETNSKAERIGQAYQSSNFKSRLLATSDNRHVWGLDPEEIEWAIQNQDSLLDQAFQVSPSAAGGVRIDSVQAGSMGAARGVMEGDVVREVNGQPLRSVADLKALMTNESVRTQSGLRLTIERAGKPVAIEYRPLPK